MKALTLVIVLFSGSAHAGGIQLPTSGVRPTARAGAFVAGAEGLQAAAFNPAGLDSIEDTTLLLDTSFVKQNISYERIDSGNNLMPGVSNQVPGTPIPTLAVGGRINDRLTWVGGLFAPYASVPKYDVDGPQRYSVGDLSNSLAIAMVVGGSYQLSDKWSVGLTVRNTIFRMVGTTTISACPGQTICAPEDPDFDAVIQAEANDWFAPSASVGVLYKPTSSWRIGGSFQGPTYVDAAGSLAVRLPSASIFDGASVSGESASTSFWLAPIAKLGVEYRGARLRVEAAASVEFWSMHDTMDVSTDEIQIDDVVGIGTYEIGTVAIPKYFRNTIAVQLGGEYRLTESWTLIGGYAYETGASTQTHANASQLDLNKHVLSAGLGLTTGRISWTAAIAAAMSPDLEVAPEIGKSTQLNPIREGNMPATYVNWGSYSSSWLVAGIGAEIGF